MMIEWYRPRTKKVSCLDKIKIYVIAYIYQNAKFEDNEICDGLELPPIRDIEYVTGINRQYVSECLNTLTAAKEDWLIKKGSCPKNTKFYIKEFDEDSILRNLQDYRELYPELFYADAENPYCRKKAVTDEDKKIDEMYDLLPDFKKWKKVE